MLAVTARSLTVPERRTASLRAAALSVLAVPALLFAVSAAVRAGAAAAIPVTLTEGSAYYVEVARNVVAGRGLVIDAIWSYATPPLVLPRPAFELWQPLASIFAALPMALFSPTLGAAQLGYVLLGALLAPLAWLVARDAAARLELPARRRAFVCLGAGLLVAVTGPFLLTTALPDSTLPFAVLATAACLVMPRAIGGDRPALVALGVLLGLAYLTRMEAIWVGAVFALLAVRSRPRWRDALRPIAGVAAMAALVAAPWWLRNVQVFGTPLPGQVTDNILLTRNEQIFAYADQPTLDAFLVQGLPTLAGNVGTAAWHNLVNVLLVPAAPVVAAGLATIAFAVLVGRGRSRSRSLAASPVGALLLAGLLTFAVTTILFPVATLWGTFEHASGPVLVGLAVAAVLGGDAFVGWLVRHRRWQRDNAWLAALALVALTLPLAGFQLTAAARQAADTARTLDSLRAVAGQLEAAGVPMSAPVITDRPIWLSRELGRPALALSDEPAPVILRLASDFDARALVVVGDRGAYPEALRAGAAAECFTELPPPAAGGSPAVAAPAVFAINAECIS